jgi:hypothetical protein
MAPSLLKKRKIRNRNLALMATALFATAVAAYYHSNFVTTTQDDSKLSCQEWMEELLNGHPNKSRITWRFRKQVFYILRIC